ncbi:MAG TPA: CPBP family intramembrane metalloprotease [Thermococcaceae archaeon]|uniref:Membrane-associated metalloprotease, CaaX family n=1 Tax=Thermococcus sibiricus TaxID=172049 RepID=A0A124FF65_9EURY|nr:CPBP family archaeomyxosortase MrtA [Thermococcus sibiricus]KUK17091.1 MAG: Membrane-associated metalloprotease, CaaX family [Thermococcus sibiricus]HII67603.1 CPBP family intramembrane metalloprotease [Thermococcaceae archaeon]
MRKLLFLYLFGIFLIILNHFLGSNIYEWALYNTLFYILVPLILALTLGLKHEDLGFKIGKRDGYKLALAFFLLTLPISLYASQLESFRNYYPLFSYNSWREFLFKELFIGVIMFAHEAFYRGILLFPLAKENEWLGIIAQNIPYTLVHIGKPPLEMPYSFIAGIVFAKIDLKSESFLPSFLLHWIGAVVFDILCITTL